MINICKILKSAGLVTALFTAAANADKLPSGLTPSCNGHYFTDQLPGHDTGINKYDLDLQYATEFYDAFAKRMSDDVHPDMNVFDYFQTIQKNFFVTLNDNELANNTSALRPRIWIESRDFETGFTKYPALIPLLGDPLTDQLDIHFGEQSLYRESSSRPPMDIWLEFSSNTTPLITYGFNYIEGFGDNNNQINFLTLLKDVNVQTQYGRPLMKVEENEGGINTFIRCRSFG